jgi:hypothetical protein
MEADYSVFVHLSNPGEQIWGQHDSQPVRGSYPTGTWQPGEIVVDQHPIEIDPAAPAGSYQLMTGMYDSSTARRLTIAPGSAIVDQDRIVLDTLEIAMPGGDEPDPGQ